MPQIRFLVSMLCVAFVLAVVLVKPLAGRAADGTTPTEPAR